MIAQSFTDLHKTIAFLVAQHIQQMKSAGDFRQVFAFYNSSRSSLKLMPPGSVQVVPGEFLLCLQIALIS